ncbi:MAG TPA: tryptophan-rich sensory protein [Patescibacteria group bacterium]|nr:tryptophan-rich sensory protein [bacterium]HRY56639.1 tryptophan-rich sensory protein [Patescibacteria group bacterium]
MKNKKILTYIGFILVCQMAGIIGSLFTAPAVKGWYTTINKSPLNPPSWVFAPVWTTLFIMMGVAVSIIWLSGKNETRSKALKVFFLQLFLNTLWSIIFFGLKNPPLAFIEIVVLWFAILYTIILFRKIDKKASYLLIPYILWVSFASVLNLSIAILN